MKRSESILVWAVTAIVGVIVLVAVIFGRTDAVVGDGGKSANGGQPLENLIAGGGAVFTEGGPAEPGAGGSGEPGAGDAGSAKGDGKPVAAAAAAGTGEPIDADLRARVPDLRTVLGEFRLEGQPDGERYRVVAVRYGDSFGSLVQRWTGSLDRKDEVRALNEGLVPEQIRAGEEIWFPWVDEQLLVDAAEQRRPGGVPSAPAGLAANLDPSRSGGSTTPASGDWYKVKSGESLWKIAADRVGQGKAQAYIDEILRLNPTIVDPARVRADDRVLMPRR